VNEVLLRAPRGAGKLGVNRLDLRLQIPGRLETSLTNSLDVTFSAADVIGLGATLLAR
jgi:hypothetical protein